MTSRLFLSSLLLCALALGGCASAPPSPEAVSQTFAGRSYVLLGEVHDNAEGQQQRLAALTRAVEAGWRPAIAMEQFDRERQPDIERARQERPHDPDYLIAQAAGERSGWQWSLYRPVVALALRYDLPLLAANLSRGDASRIVRGGFGSVFSPGQTRALGLDVAMPADLVASQTAELDAGHCGHFPKMMLPGMLKAQAARDAMMAATLKPYADRGAVLIAGNGHVRRDLGVPRWLGGDARKIVSVGYLEDDGRLARGFDAVVLVPVIARKDPCTEAVMR
ncbi:ChaN family lipoprotein [Cupriavidus sp. Marseille-Q8015]